MDENTLVPAGGLTAGSEKAGQIFAFGDAMVRTVERNGEPWFNATDIARILEYDHTPSMVRYLEEDEKGVLISHTLGGNQNVTFINESGLYHAIFMSRKEAAKEFRRWVTGTVLPEIRKTGGFGKVDVTKERLELDYLRQTRLMISKLESLNARGVIENGDLSMLACEILRKSHSAAEVKNAAFAKYEHDDDIRSFFNACYELTFLRTDFIKVSELYADYCAFTGSEELTRNKFTRRVQEIIDGLDYGQKKIGGYPELVFFGIKKNGCVEGAV